MLLLNEIELLKPSALLRRFGLMFKEEKLV